MKNYFVTSFILACLAFAPARGQTQGCDTIYQTNGRIIAADIQKMEKNEVSYCYCGDPAKKTMLVKNTELIRIKYRNNEVKVFSEATTTGLSKKWHIEMTDGNEFVGELVVEDAEKVILKTEALGDITLRRINIKTFVPVSADQYVNGEYWFRNPHDTRYYFGPNGYPIRKGEGYYQNAWILYNQVSFGFSENFSAGAGMVPLFLFGADFSPVWVTPRLSIPVVKNRFNIAAGAFMGAVMGVNRSGFGIVYGAATAGPRDANATLGIGYGYLDGEFASEPTFSLSFMKRAGKKIAVISENYTIKTGDERLTLISIGARFLGKKLAIDAALIAPFFPDQGAFFAVPWLGINVPFGNQRPDK